MLNFDLSNHQEPIPGLMYYPNVISLEDGERILRTLDTHTWVQLTRRRVQYYGYKYDVVPRTSTGLYIGPLPLWLQNIADELYGTGHYPAVPDAALVNEYLPGQGLGSHVDEPDRFAPCVAILSLGSGVQVDYTPVRDKIPPVSLFVEPRSLILMTGDSFHHWEHGIAARCFDPVDDTTMFARGRRVSLTIRKIIY